MIRKINWFFIVAGTLIMMVIMMRTGESLKTPTTPMGILNLEFAYTGETASAVMSAWQTASPSGGDNIQSAIKNTWLDFVFLFFYSLFLFYACKTIAETFSGTLESLGKFLAMGALNAGLLDIAENTGMLLMLHGYTTNSLAMLTTLFAMAKWALALTALVYIIVTLPFYLYKKIK